MLTLSILFPEYVLHHDSFKTISRSVDTSTSSRNLNKGLSHNVISPLSISKCSFSGWVMFTLYHLTVGGVVSGSSHPATDKVKSRAATIPLKDPFFQNFLEASPVASITLGCLFIWLAISCMQI